MNCLEANAGRRRIFWSTQPQACGEYSLCDAPCVIPGLAYVDSEDPYIGAIPRTISNDQWLRGLVLNILNTKARTDLKCPSPAAVYGHWSESYRGDGLYVGSTLWNAVAKSYTRVADSVKAIGSAIRADMAKLTALKIADSVEVKAIYKGGNRVDVEITATVTNARHVLNLSGSLATGTWTWA